MSAKADSLTKVQRNAAGNQFSISAHDLLNYAKLALIGGEQAIADALRKSANKIASRINQKAKNILLFQPLPTPFPEVKQR